MDEVDGAVRLHFVPPPHALRATRDADRDDDSEPRGRRWGGASERGGGARAGRCGVSSAAPRGRSPRCATPREATTNLAGGPVALATASREERAGASARAPWRARGARAGGMPPVAALPPAQEPGTPAGGGDARCRQSCESSDGEKESQPCRFDTSTVSHARELRLRWGRRRARSLRLPPLAGAHNRPTPPLKQQRTCRRGAESLGSARVRPAGLPGEFGELQPHVRAGVGGEEDTESGTQQK